MIVYFDTETHLIKTGMTAPKMVCMTWDIDGEQHIANREESIPIFRKWINDPECHLVGHNVAYDLGILAAEEPGLLKPIFDAFDAGRIKDTKIRQQLIDIEKGELKFKFTDEGKPVKSDYGLAGLIRLWFNRMLPKEDTYRLRYNELDGIPIKDWPPEAVSYAMNDAKATREVFERQQSYMTATETKLPDEAAQNRAAWALHLLSLWGVRTEAEAVKLVKARLEKSCAEAMVKLKASGIVKVKGTKKNPKDVRDLAEVRKRVEAACIAQGVDPPRTEKGSIATDEESLRESGDPDLLVIADASSGLKLLNTYVPTLEKAAEVPLCARYNVLVETGRTSCSGDKMNGANMQNPPREGGIRECFVPRPGYLYCSVDYDTLELRTLAQVCLHFLGSSQLAEAFKRGEDPHLNLAANLLGITTEEAIKRYAEGDPEIKKKRQFAKIPNFGFPGGLGAATFVDYAKGFGQIITESEAKDLRSAWFATWPEMKDYFNLIAKQVGSFEGTITQLRSERIRGKVTFTAAANGYFQGLAADGAKAALWNVSRECYIGSPPLLRSRPVIFVHDEIIAEVPEDQAHSAAYRMAEIMRESMQVFTPDVPIKCKPVLMRRWWKGAEPVHSDGVLVPSKPLTDEHTKKVTWIHDLKT